jgi:hypothetical protein
MALTAEFKRSAGEMFMLGWAALWRFSCKQDEDGDEFLPIDSLTENARDRQGKRKR